MTTRKRVAVTNVEQGHGRAQAQIAMAHGVYLRQRNVQADGKQQEGDAEFGQRLDLLSFDDRTGGVGTERDADQQITRAGRDTQPMESDPGRRSPAIMLRASKVMTAGFMFR